MTKSEQLAHWKNIANFITASVQIEEDFRCIDGRKDLGDNEYQKRYEWLMNNFVLSRPRKQRKINLFNELFGKKI